MNPKPLVHARVTRQIDASPERVFDAWLDPAQVRQWMRVSGSMKNLTRVTIDARVGGSFSFVDLRDGAEVDHIGEYLEIDRPRRLMFTWGIRQDQGDTSRVIIDIAPLESGCEVTLTHEMDVAWADFVSRAEAAWAKMLDGIAATLE